MFYQSTFRCLTNISQRGLLMSWLFLHLLFLYFLCIAYFFEFICLVTFSPGRVWNGSCKYSVFKMCLFVLTEQAPQSWYFSLLWFATGLPYPFKKPAFLHLFLPHTFTLILERIKAREMYVWPKRILWNNAYLSLFLTAFLFPLSWQT